MRMKSDIKLIIHNIENVLRSSEDEFYSISLKDGILGLSLFYYYYYLYTNEEKHLSKVSYFLEKSLAYLTNGKIESFSMFDLIDLGNYVCFLYQKECIHEEDAKQILNQIDPHISELLELKIKEKDLGSLKGVISIGNYLTNKKETFLTNNNEELERIIHVIDTLSIQKDSKSIFWKFPMRNKEEPIVELGFYHGVSGIIYFLSRMVENGILKEKSKEIISKSISYLLTFKQNKPFTLFPLQDIRERRTKKNHQCIGYGDIGIGYTFLRLGKLIESSYSDLGIEILENASNFRDDDSTFIKDAELIYGATGLFSFFDRFKHLSKNFKEAADYWFKRVTNFNCYKTEWAGYSTYINGFDNTIQLSFQHGLIGIGVALINYELEEVHDYLVFLNYKQL